VYENLLPAQLRLRGENPEGYFMIPNWLLPWDFDQRLDAGLIGAPCNLGAATWLGTHEAPNAIREACGLFATRSFDFETDVRDLRARDIGDIRTHVTDLQRTHENIETTLVELYRHDADFTPIVIGGDRSISVPSARGFSIAHGAKLGIIRLGAGDVFRQPAYQGAAPSIRDLVNGKNIHRDNVVQVGLHGFLDAPAPKDSATASPSHNYSAREVRRRGIGRIMDEAIEHASAGTDGVYVSVDIDVLDPAYAPGARLSCPGGLEPGDVFEAVYQLGACVAVKALDLVEVDPLRDVKAATSRLAVIIMMSFLVGLHQRKHGTTPDMPTNLRSISVQEAAPA
jgi:formiminoglutamase